MKTTTWEGNTTLIEDGESIFIIAEVSNRQLTGRYVTLLDHAIFNQVDHFVQCFPDIFLRLSHDEVVNVLLKLIPDATPKELSTCLSALGH